MLTTMLEKFIKAWQLIPFTGATWFVLFTLGFFVWLFTKASRDPLSLINWEHLLIDSETNRASPYKVGYLVGIIVSTWLVITMLDTGKLTFDILGAYLTFLLGGASVNTWVKRTTPPSPPTPAPPPKDE